MADRYDVCVVGSANLDLVATTSHLPRPGETVLGTHYAEHAGGKGLNQAVAASRSGAATTFVGALGSDDAGRRLREVLATEQIDATATPTVEAPTGRAMITVDDAGENSIVVIPGANASVSSDTDLPAATVVLAQLEIPIESVLSALTRARAAGRTVILNPAPAAPLPVELAACDVIVPNEHELAQLGGVGKVLESGCGAVLVTLGSDGVAINTTAGTSRVAAFDVEVVDTTGAGDAFCGALGAARLAAGDELLDAVRWATAAGALATTVHGAVPAQPAAAAIEALLQRR